MDIDKNFSRKKKLRQRNRPRNKANLVKNSISVSEENTANSQNGVQLPAVLDKRPLSKTIEKNNSSDSKIKLSGMNLNHSFMESLQKEMDELESSIGNAVDFPSKLFGNLQKLINQEPITDVETSDDEDEYVEYIYNPRKYFVVSLCNFCKCDLKNLKMVQCRRCKMTYYCGTQHMELDEEHRQICYGLRQVAENYDGHIFYKCENFNPEQFRSYRILAIRKTEEMINRKLTTAEQEIILFPRICSKRLQRISF